MRALMSLGPLTGLECCAGGRSWWLRQSGILAPWSTVPVGVPRALVCSTAPGGSSAGVLSGSTVGVEDIIFGPTAEAADCALIRFGSPAAAAVGASVGSTAAAGSSDGALCGSTAGAGAKEILFGSTAVDAGCASFGSTAVAGSSRTFESCSGRAGCARVRDRQAAHQLGARLRRPILFRQGQPILADALHRTSDWRSTDHPIDCKVANSRCARTGPLDCDRGGDATGRGHQPALGQHLSPLRLRSVGPPVAAAICQGRRCCRALCG